jgi:hypothetical protein
MLADPLTKGMRHLGLEKLMTGAEVCLTPTKYKVCETEHGNMDETA